MDSLDADGHRLNALLVTKGHMRVRAHADAADACVSASRETDLAGVAAP